MPYTQISRQTHYRSTSQNSLLHCKNVKVTDCSFRLSSIVCLYCKNTMACNSKSLEITRLKNKHTLFFKERLLSQDLSSMVTAVTAQTKHYKTFTQLKITFCLEDFDQCDTRALRIKGPSSVLVRVTVDKRPALTQYLSEYQAPDSTSPESRVKVLPGHSEVYVCHQQLLVKKSMFQQCHQINILTVPLDHSPNNQP